MSYQLGGPAAVKLFRDYKRYLRDCQRENPGR